MMLKANKAFSSFSVNDIQKAKDFYAQTLGVKVSHEDEHNLLRLHIGNEAPVMIYPKPNHSAASFTVLILKCPMSTKRSTNLPSAAFNSKNTINRI